MAHFTRKYFLIALLLTVFTGQSFAALLAACPHMDASENNAVVVVMDHSNMSDMAHMHHGAPAEQDIDTHSQQSDCCKQLHHCSGGGCSTAMLSGAIFVFSNNARIDVVDDYHTYFPSALSSSLFRPPILG